MIINYLFNDYQWCIYRGMAVSGIILSKFIALGFDRDFFIFIFFPRFDGCIIPVYFYLKSLHPPTSLR